MQKSSKKAAKSKKSGTSSKVINPADYQRQPVEMATLGNVPQLDKLLHGKILNIEELFPEWNIENENWTDSIVAVEAEFPRHIEVASYKSAKGILGLGNDDSSTDKNGKTEKKEAKKMTKGSLLELMEVTHDENGKSLPRMFIENSSSILTADDPLYYNLRRPYLEDLHLSNSKNTPTFTRAEDKIFSKEKVHDYKADIERDPLMCAAFNLIAKFAPSILSRPVEEIQDNNSITSSPTSSSEPPFPYLWHAIYPKMKNGLPGYNPFGKYLVKMYLAGKWRKVLVTDHFPVATDGRPAIAASSDPLELWPSVLAKAVYTVYTACGYHQTFLDVGVGQYGPTAAHRASAFVGFAVHVLTGWLPSNAWSIAETVDQDLERFGGLMQEILFGGSVLVSPDDIPGHEPVIRKKKNADNAQKDRKMTKKQWKAEIRRKLEEKDLLLQAIVDREKQIERIDGLINKPFSEAFLIFIPVTTGGVRVLKILGMSFSDDKNINNTLVLINWNIGEPVDQPPPGEGSIEGSIPCSTPIHSIWVSVEDLCKAGAYFLGIDTRIRLSHKVSLGWHWALPVVEESKKPVKKGKEGTKEKLRRTSISDTGEPLNEITELGPFPPMLLSIDPSQFLSGLPPDALNSQRGELHRKKPRGVGTVGNGTTASQSSIEEETFMRLFLSRTNSKASVEEGSIVEDEDFSSPRRGDKKKKALDALRKSRVYLSLSVVMHADQVKLKSLEVEGNADDAASTGTESSAVEGGEEAKGGGGDDDIGELMRPEAVLVLQEIRTDGEEPLVMRLQLGSKANIPLARTTFNIPVDRVPTKPFAFWVRLFTRSSLYFEIHCGCQVTLGPAAEIWESMGGHSTAMSGEVAPTWRSFERVVMRLPFSLQSSETAEESAVTHALNADVFEPTVVDNVLCFVTLSRKDLTPYFSLLTHEETSGNQMVLPGIDCNILSLSSKETVTLLGRSYHPSIDLPAFTWKLVLLHQKHLQPLPPPPIVPPSPQHGMKRYQGPYIPNNRHVLFRDVLSVDSQSFPVALRISLHQLEHMTAAAAFTVVDDNHHSPPVSIDIENDVGIELKLFRKSDRKPICEYNARGILQVYKIDIEHFLPDSPEDQDSVSGGPGSAVSVKSNASKLTAAGAGGGAKKKEKPPKKESKEAVIELLVECVIDATAMHVPPRWRSRQPYAFCGELTPDGSNTESRAELKTSEKDTDSTTTLDIMSTSMLPPAPQFSWTMDVMGGNVLSAVHDLYDLQRFAAMKNSWEEGSEGREERAVAAVMYYSEMKKQIVQMGPEFGDLNQFSNSTVSDDKDKDRVSTPTLGGKRKSAAGKSKQRAISPNPSTNPGGKKSAHNASGLSLEPVANPLDGLAQHLSTALELDVELVKGREEMAASLSKYHEYVEELADGEAVTFVTAQDLEQVAKLREAEIAASESFASTALDRLLRHNEVLRQTAKSRIGTLLDTSTLNTEEIKRTWMRREKYRLALEKKNTTLKQLQEMAENAIESTGDDDRPEASKNDKKTNNKFGKDGKGKDNKLKKK